MARNRRSAREKLRQARDSLYRQHILEAAEGLLAEKGMAETSMQEIGRRAGLSMGTIYSVFDGKESLLESLLAWRGEEIRDMVRTVVKTNEDPWQAVRALLREYVRYFAAHPAFLRLHLRLGSAWSLSPANGGGRAAVWEEIHRLQAELMARGMEAGVFIDEEPALLARLFSAVDQVLLARWVEHGMEPGENELLAQLEMWVGRLVLRQPCEAYSSAPALADR